MFEKLERKKYQIKAENFNISLLESGNILEIRDDIVRLNTYLGNNLEETIGNVFIRVKENGEYFYAPMIGIGSNSYFEINEEENYCTYKGEFREVQYLIILTTFENACVIDVKLKKNDKEKIVDVIFGIDVAINNIYAISSNEAYVSQYIDHYAYLNRDGYTILSRQNQGGGYYLEVGSLTKNVGYTTDGFDFYKNSYKKDNVINALKEGRLVSRINQYEFSFVSLESEAMDLSEDRNVIFYFAYTKDINYKVEKPLFKENIINYKKKDIKVGKGIKFNNNINFNECIFGKELTEDEIDNLFGDRRYEEKKEGKLLSFFRNDYSHVVLPIKEEMMERPSGDIIISNCLKSDATFDFEKIIGETSYIYGVFLSQVVLGNTSFNKLLTNIRNPLNISKISGTRIFIKSDGRYKLLTMPSAFVMGLNYFSWYYKLDDDLIKINVLVSKDKGKIELSYASRKNRDILITNNLVMGEREHENDYEVINNCSGIDIKFLNRFISDKYPDLFFKIRIDKEFEVYDDAFFFEDKKRKGEDIVVFKLKNKEFNYLISSGYEDEKHLDFSKETKNYLDGFNSMLNGFEIKSKDENLNSFNILSRWFLHDALIHYLSPHGLEQYNGAAWGLRDVCQGPAELMLSLGKYEEVRNIIKTVYSHQFLETGDFPQWFMFDKFYQIQDLSSHGDIIVWPIRMLAMYLKESGDYSILEEEVPYTKKEGIIFTSNTKIIEHLDYEIEAIKKNVINGTHLPIYGGGDWDDTLQPAIASYKKEMVSGWTPLLTYEALMKIADALCLYDKNRASSYLDLASKIKADYNKYVIKDGVPAGSIRFTDDNIIYVLHPSDEVTKIKYRLLPLTRSIISEFVTLDDALKYSKIIDENLSFPDGVRLMSSAVEYNGGIKKFFNRAETASNFGREIGLMYTHANIRYTEAMHKLGDGDKVYLGLQKVNPVIYDKFVSNAKERQRTSYFSSSDGEFINRYEAYANFNKLKDGSVKVKGGWRVYSSGPGIYLSMIIRGLLGLNNYNDKILIDPVIPKELLGFSFKYKINGKNVLVKYLSGDNNLIVNGEVVNSRATNKYRGGGFIFDSSLLNKEENVIEVYLNG